MIGVSNQVPRFAFSRTAGGFVRLDGEGELEDGKQTHQSHVPPRCSRCLGSLSRYLEGGVAEHPAKTRSPSCP